MYKKETQLAFEDYVFPFGELDSENEWVKLAGLILWDTVERAYAEQFVDNGHPAHSARIALGALIIKQLLKCSDEWTVRHVSENPYLQFFLPDWLLVYRVEDDILVLTLTRTGTHSVLFGK